jgi:hypothetical protein
LFQVFRQTQDVFRRNLRNYVLGFAVDHFDHHALRVRVFLKDQIVIFAEPPYPGESPLPPPATLA